MLKSLSATLASILLAFMLNGIAFAAEWVPPGFESLNEPQVTQVDLYYGDEFLISVFARFTQTELSFLNTDAITQLLQNLSDPESLNEMLQQPFGTNANAICHSDYQQDCGRLQPETVDIIFDRNSLRADLFINPELLLAGQPLQNRFLPDSSAEFSLFTDNTILFSGVDQDQTTYNFVNTTRIALAESRLMISSNVTDTQGLSVDTLAWQKEYQGKDYQVGLFRGNSSNFRFMGSEQFLGASIASSVLTRIDLDQSLGTEIELFFGSRSRIEILRDERLLASGYYDVGNQIIDTSMLPPGSYEIEIRITDSSGAMTTEHRFFSKTSKLPPEDQAIYFLQAGKLTDQGISGGIPQQGISVVRGGYSKRLSPSLGADLGFSSTPDSNVYSAGLYKMGPGYEVKAEVAMEDNGAYGSDVSVRWDLDFIRLNLSSRKVWEGDSQLQLGDGYTQNSVSVDMPSRWGSFGLFARTNKRDMGIASNNYGFRWQASSRNFAGGNLSAGFELSRNDDDVLAMLSLSYRFNGSRSQHSFTPGMTYESIPEEQYRRTSLQGSHLSSWTYGADEQRRLTLRADRDTQTSFEARFEDRHRVVDSDFSARYNVEGQQLEYSGKLSSSFAYTPTATGFGGRPRGDSAFIVSVDGVPDGSEFEVMVNGSSRGNTLSGKRLLIPVSPYETYRVELNSISDEIIDLDDTTFRKTVYPGNVIPLKWSGRVIKIIIGRIIDESGDPIKGALIRNVKGFGVTDDRGFFQTEIEENVKSLIIQKGIDVCEARFEIEDMTKKVVSLGKLTCVEIDDPIVKAFQQYFDTEVESDLAATDFGIPQQTTAPSALQIVSADSDAILDSAGEVFTNFVVHTSKVESPTSAPIASAVTDFAVPQAQATSTDLAAPAAVSLSSEEVTPAQATQVQASATIMPVTPAPLARELADLGLTNSKLVDSIKYSFNINDISLIPKTELKVYNILWARPPALHQGAPDEPLLAAVANSARIYAGDEEFSEITREFIGLVDYVHVKPPDRLKFAQPELTLFGSLTEFAPSSECAGPARSNPSPIHFARSNDSGYLPVITQKHWVSGVVPYATQTEYRQGAPPVSIRAGPIIVENGIDISADGAHQWLLWKHHPPTAPHLGREAGTWKFLRGPPV